MVTETFADSDHVERSLRELALRFITNLIQPEVLRLRRLVIATADRFPDVGRTWYESGFERALEALAGSFELLTACGALNVEDPVVAANHFVGLLLWIPVNRVMFVGVNPYSESDLTAFAMSQLTRSFERIGSADPRNRPASNRNRLDADLDTGGTLSRLAPA